jgi:crossover junction endodeoxyribonuclease RuvC
VFVLGIDPGLSRLGYGCVEPRRGGGATAVAVGVLTTSPAAPLPSRLAELQRDLRALIAELRPDVVAVERVFFQVNVRTAVSVAQASGVAIAEAAATGCEVVEYTPSQVKQAVAGDGSAGKEEMERMVQTLLGIRQPLRPVDAADAVALALCHLAHAPQLRLLARSETTSGARSAAGGGR